MYMYMYISVQSADVRFAIPQLIYFSDLVPLFELLAVPLPSKVSFDDDILMFFTKCKAY